MARSGTPQATTDEGGQGTTDAQATAADRAGIAAVVAGCLFFLGQGGELVLGDDSDLVFAVLVTLLAVAILAFGVAFWSLRSLLRSSRAGRVGAGIGLAGTAFLVAFAVQLAIAAATTGEVPENFTLFAVGFLLFVVAHFVIARPLRHLIGSAWWLSPVAAVTLFAALAVDETYIWHDLALFAFEACWIGMGVLLLRSTRGRRHHV